MKLLRILIVTMAALLAALGLGVHVAAAQTISNTASASWTEQGQARTTTSNTVSFSVLQQNVEIDTFAPSSNGQTISYAATSCGSAQSGQLIGGGQSLQAAVTPSTTIRIGQTLYFRVTAPAANTNPAAVDSLVVTLTSPTGDRETVTVFETAANSGEFFGAIQTRAVPPAPVHDDCKLSVTNGGTVTITTAPIGSSQTVVNAQIDVLADPYGMVFDSENGAPVNGAQVTLVDAATGQPARVFGDDGVTPWPSMVFSGQPVTDGNGVVHVMQPGEYRFPLAALGQYRIVIVPPAPYTAPSVASPAQLASLRRPDGNPFEILPASFGQVLTLSGPTPIRVDIPLDSPPVAVAVSKTASRPTALPGDAVFYTVTLRNPDPLHAKTGVTLVDVPSSALRLKADSVRVDGVAAPGAVTIAPDGRSLTIAIGTVAPNATRTVTYAMTVRPGTPAGAAVNTATATDDRGRTGRASATVRIARDDLGARVTLIGRITDGGCNATGVHNPVPGVRVVLEDGSYAITDADGRYHFEGLTPGSHVVQAQTATLPKGGQFVDCTRSARSAGGASSRFVMGSGGQLLVEDFSAVLPAGAVARAEQPRSAAPVVTAEARAAAEKKASGADTNWLAIGDGPTQFLFPAMDHNPRAPAIRVVIRHRVDEKIELMVDGRPVDPVAFDGTQQAPGGRYAVSVWRGVQLDGENTRLTAVVRGPRGAVSELVRDVHYSGAPARIELVPAKSRLVADGSTRPVLALRILDRDGRPVRAGLTGEFRLSAPYESAEALDAMQERALSGLGRTAPRWHVQGDDGMAYVELAPTMASGKLRADFDLSDGQQTRRIELEAWIVPGQQPWTVVGLAEGSVGAKTVADQMERTGRFDSDLGDKARVAVYAKGPIADGLLLTASYDSAKQRDDQVLMGAIDPRAYYTVFADVSDHLRDAQSLEKLYARIEGAGFYALYGDFNSGFDQTQLARYQRTATGFKGEAAIGDLQVQAFGAKIASVNRRDEFQGGGISGPYRLSSRAMIPGSEVVTIEVRDRFRSEVIVSRKTLVRFVDYDIDLLSGTITFKEPLLSRDTALNPQFAVVTYEVDENAGGGEINAGVRLSYNAAKGRLRLGASAITDAGQPGQGRRNLAAVDLRARVGKDTELRAEVGTSFGQGREDIAWLVEVEHHDGNLDLLAYARYADREFGLGQTNGAELGRRKFGVDARYRVTEALALTATAWRDENLGDPARRTAVQLGATWRSRNTDARIGLATMKDRLADGTSATSTVLEGGVTQRLLNNKLELSLASSVALGKAEALDLPERHRITARYRISPDLRLVGSYELAKGEGTDARTAQFGVELSPWNGARVTTGLGQQSINEFGKRSFATFGLAQSIPVTANLTVDATLDGNRTLSGFDPDRLVNLAQPASSGGNLGENGTIAEDFTAVTLGASWRKDRWSATLRGEWRDGELADRKGVTFGAIRQLGEGQMLGAGFTWTRATAETGASSEVFDGAIALASRPADSEFAFLTKIQFRGDRVSGAVAGEAGPAGRGALTINGSGRSDRIIGSVSANWSPRGVVDGQIVQRDELGLFVAARHNLDRVEGFDLKGTTLLGGIDMRLGFGDRIELGASGTVSTNLDDKTTKYAFGPHIGFSPTKDVLVTVGYNFSGFRDPDFSAARNTDQGVYVSLRMKFDADTFGFLGLRN